MPAMRDGDNHDIEGLEVMIERYEAAQQREPYDAAVTRQAVCPNGHLTSNCATDSSQPLWYVHPHAGRPAPR